MQKSYHYPNVPLYNVFCNKKNQNKMEENLKLLAVKVK